MKRYFVYGNLPSGYDIIGYIDAKSYDCEHPMVRGACQKAAAVFGPRVDVVECGMRKANNMSFERVSDTVFKRASM